MLLITGVVWYLVASVNAYAVAAGTGRGRALGAYLLSSLVFGVALLVLVLLAAVAYFGFGGSA